MKHKKLIIIMAIVVIMATFTISTFAEIPTEAVTGYYIIYDDASNSTNNSISASLNPNKIAEYIKFIVVGNEYYFIDNVTYEDSETFTATVTGTGSIPNITLDILDEGLNSSPSNMIIYWSEQTVSDAQSAYAEEITSIEEMTYTPNEESTTNNIYADIYTMVKQYIFGGAELSANQDLVATLTATWSCILLVMLPFVIVWGIFKLFVR